IPRCEAAARTGRGNTMTQLAEPKSIHLSNFARLEERAGAGHGNGSPGGRAWLDGMRRGAIARFEQVGFPLSSKDEHWRHTNFAPIARTEFHLAGPDVASARA